MALCNLYRPHSPDPDRVLEPFFLGFGRHLTWEAPCHPSSASRLFYPPLNCRTFHSTPPTSFSGKELSILAGQPGFQLRQPSFQLDQLSFQVSQPSIQPRQPSFQLWQPSISPRQCYVPVTEGRFQPEEHCIAQDDLCFASHRRIISQDKDLSANEEECFEAGRTRAVKNRLLFASSRESTAAKKASPQNKPPVVNRRAGALESSRRPFIRHPPACLL